MNIVVFGANGPTGRLLTKQALAEGHTATAVTRHPETFPFTHECLQVRRADVFDLASVEQAVSGKDAVLSVLGVPFSRRTITLYSQGTAHIVQAMNHHGVRRLVCVSSAATDPHRRFHDTGGGFVFEKILKPFFVLVVGRTLYADLRRMETLVMNSRLEWTIVRPSGLFETLEVTNYRVAETYISGRFTSRADLADCMLQQLADDRYLRKAVAVATFSAQPGLFEFLGREAFKHRLDQGVPEKT